MLPTLRLRNGCYAPSYPVVRALLTGEVNGHDKVGTFVTLWPTHRTRVRPVIGHGNVLQQKLKRFSVNGLTEMKLPVSRTLVNLKPSGVFPLCLLLWWGVAATGQNGWSQTHLFADFRNWYYRTYRPQTLSLLILWIGNSRP